MKVGRLIKENLAKIAKDGLEKKSSTFVMNYTKVSGQQMSELRKSLKKVGAELFISRNRVAARALKDMKFDQLSEGVGGQTAFVWSDADSAEVSKALVDFNKQCEDVLLQGGILDGALLSKEDIKRLSELPSREVLLTMLAQTIQAPLTRLARALNAKTYDLLSVLKQLSEKKGGK